MLQDCLCLLKHIGFEIRNIFPNQLNPLRDFFRSKEETTGVGCWRVGERAERRLEEAVGVTFFGDLLLEPRDDLVWAH